MAPAPPAAALIDWILRHVTADDDIDALISVTSQRLCDAGLPLRRMNMAVPTIDPHHRALAVNWQRGAGITYTATKHAEDDTVYLRSPVAMLVAEDRRAGHWRLEVGEGCNEYPLLAELRAEGCTDYRLHVVAFSPGTAMMGSAISFATDRPGGFSVDDAALIEAIVPALGLAAYRLNLSHTMREVLGAYLGSMTATRVLAGEIRRGRGEIMSAAILLADLKRFTTLTDHEDPLRVVGWLNQHFEAVAEHGGEILKFTGDGFIAVFPADEAVVRPCPICGKALAAAETALVRNRELNAERRLAGEPELAVDLVLHFGDVIYGNVGTSRRLDFTTIGRAVNEASRIETLCDPLGRNLLLSDSFVARCTRSFHDLGRFPLRGIDGARRLWTV